MNMPSQSWKEFMCEIKLAVSRGERRGKQSTQNIFCICSPSLFIFFPFLTFPPFVWECHASFDTMPGTEGSCSGLVPKRQGNKLEWIVIFTAAVSARPWLWHRQGASTGRSDSPRVRTLPAQRSVFAGSYWAGKICLQCPFLTCYLSWCRIRKTADGFSADGNDMMKERRNTKQSNVWFVSVRGWPQLPKDVFFHACAHLTSWFWLPEQTYGPKLNTMPRSTLGNGFGLLCSIAGIDQFSLNREKLPALQHLSFSFWYFSSAFLLCGVGQCKRAEMQIFWGVKYIETETWGEKTNKQARILLAFPLPCEVEMRKPRTRRYFFISGKGWDLPVGKELEAVNTNSQRIAADCVSRARSVIKGRLTRFGFVLTIHTTAQGRNLIY